MKINYRHRLFLYFFAVFTIFTVMVVAYQQMREREYKKEKLMENLDVYSQLIEKHGRKELLPSLLRITIMDKGGRVLYDNDADTTKGVLPNHFDRPEIAQASATGKGWSIRRSATLDKPLLYYARTTPDGYIRVALPYDYEAKEMLQPDKTFLAYVLVLFVISLVLLWFVARRFGYDMERLKAGIIAQQTAKAALKSEMTSAISHELRTPVSAIRGYTETLLDTDMPDEKRELFIERTHASAVRLSELLRDISLLTKIEESDEAFNKEDIDIKGIIAKVQEEFDKQITSNSIKVSVNIPDGVKVSGNYTLIYSIFRNLTENAVKYAGKWITLQYNLVRGDDKFYYFEVCDSGQGVKAKDLDRIFERFYRGENSGRSREDGGSGLGLAIVRHAVLRHGGEISASDNPGGGLRISFSLQR